VKSFHVAVSKAYWVSNFAKDAVEIVLKKKSGALGIVPG